MFYDLFVMKREISERTGTPIKVKELILSVREAHQIFQIRSLVDQRSHHYSNLRRPTAQKQQRDQKQEVRQPVADELEL